jgi:rod shape-determining protein MreD
MTAPRFLLGAATVLTAILLQTTIIARLPLPGVAPDLVLVLVVAYALIEGPLQGMTTGFVAGVLLDGLSDHQLGRLALAYAVVGYLAGLIHDDTERSTLVPFMAVAMGGFVGVLLFAGEGMLLGDPRVGLYAVVRSLISSVPYDVVLTPFVIPPVGALVRRLDPEPVRR